MGPYQARQGLGAGLLQAASERLQLVREQVPVDVQVMLAVACPSWRWTALTLAPWRIISDAAVCRPPLVGLLLPVRLAWGAAARAVAGAEGRGPVEPEPWSLAVRFRHEPRGLRRYLVVAGSPADGRAIRDGQVIPVQGATTLRAGDEVIALTDPERAPDLTAVFTALPRPDWPARAVADRPEGGDAWLQGDDPS